MDLDISSSHGRGLRAGLIVLLLLILCGGRTSAQAQHGVQGRVLDEQGEPLVGANVLIDDGQTGTVTNDEGYYRLTGLAPAVYTLTFRFVGFAPQQRTVDLQDGDATVNVRMEPAVLEAEEVVVTEEADAAMLSRASRSVSMLETAELDRMRGQTFSETLAELPGVTTLSTGPTIEKPVVRGLHSQRLVLLNAGVPQEGQQWGGEHAPEIDPFAAGEVEVIRGAASVEYGVGAIGGVIRVEPRELPETPGVGGELYLNGYSNNRQGAGSLVLEGGLAALPGVGWRVQGTYRRAGDSQAPDYVIGNSAFEERDVNVGLGYHRDGLGLEAQFSRFDTDLGIYRGAHINNLSDLQRAIERGEPLVEYEFSYDIDAPKQSITHDLLSVRGHLRLPAGDQVELKYGLQRNHRQEFDAHRGGQALTGERPSFDLSLVTNTLEAKLTHRPIRSLVGSVGLSWMNQANRNQASGFLIPNFRAMTGGAFVHESLVTDRWTLEGGARFDLRWMEAWPYDTSARAFERATHQYASGSGVMGVVYRFAPAWSLSANAGTGWRPPGVNELYSDGVHHGTAQYEIGDASLSGERSLDLSLTLRHASRRWQAEVSLYRNRIDDYIFLLPAEEPLVTIRGVFPLFFYDQADALLQGVDGFVQGHVLRYLQLSARASLLRADNRTTGQPLYGMPANRLGFDAHVDLPRLGVMTESYVKADLQLVFEQGRVPDGLDYAPPPAGYQLVGLRYGATLDWAGHPVQMSLGIKNLFDTAYRDYLGRFRYFIDQPGRSVVFQLQLPFGHSFAH